MSAILALALVVVVGKEDTKGSLYIYYSSSFLSLFLSLRGSLVRFGISSFLHRILNLHLFTSKPSFLAFPGLITYIYIYICIYLYLLFINCPHHNEVSHC